MPITAPVFAVLAPFMSNGDVDFGVMGEYLAFLEECGVETIATNGTTGEFPSLDLGERERLLAFCRKSFGGKIVNNVGSTCLKDTLRLMNSSKTHADAVVVPPPYYYTDADEEGVRAFFAEALKASPLPVFLYNIPQYTKVSIRPAMVSALKEGSSRLVGIKDSGGDIDLAQAFKRVTPELQVLVGNDARAQEVLLRGLDGSVTGAGNAAPEFLLRIHKQFADRQREAARKTQSLFDTWNSYRKGLTWNEIAITKAGMAARLKGFPLKVRPPLQEVPERKAEEIAHFLEENVLPLLR